MYKITYAVFHSDATNSFDASHAGELTLDTNDITIIHKEINKAINKDEGYRGYKLVSIESIGENSDKEEGKKDVI